MPDYLLAPISTERLKELFQTYERGIRVRNYRTCGVLAIVFMLAGSSLDWIVYGVEGAVRFSRLRFMCVAILAVVEGLLLTNWGRRTHRVLGLVMASPLIGSIAWMIYIKEGAESPYYAGLNLVLLGAAVLMRWTLTDSIIVVIATLGAYLAACFAHGPIHNPRIFFNNLYFLFVTGVFTTAGTWIYNRIRLSEFALRYDLDISRAKLETANEKLEENNRKLRELDEAKSRFFANISHELRTPLTLLIAPLEALMNRSRGRSSEDSEMLGTMHANAMRLLKLINDLLDLVRLESGRLQMRPVMVNIAEFVSAQTAAVKRLAGSKDVTVLSQCDPTLGRILADEDKLERICLNLLFNAIKFTPEGGRVDFKAAKQDGWLQLQVSDTGVGIAPEQLKHVFDRFWQADTSSQRKHQGMGIGLALVKELVEVQGGMVSAESELNRGTTMTVRLPFTAAPEGPARDPAPAKAIESSADHQGWLAELYRRADLFPAQLAPRSKAPAAGIDASAAANPVLLIADDEPDMLQFLRSQLSASFQIVEAVDGQQAVEKAAEFEPDVILCDMMMPGKDGLQTCREIRESPCTRPIPVVMLTAKADEQTKMDCLKAGASDFLAKPFSLAEVTARLKNLAASRLYEKQLARQKQQLELALEQLKETEALLVRNEKLASLGRLSAGLIHEINNPLHYAKQALYVLRRMARSMSEEQRAGVTEIVQDVEGGIDRVARIISDLRGFSSMSPESSEHFRLKPTVEATLRFFSESWENGVRLDVDIPDEIEIVGQRNHVLQVLINLIQNSLDAVLAKKFPRGEKPVVSIRASQDQDRVFIRIRDNGSGIDPEIASRIFDPFFTTKDVGEGMGLGLAISHRIIMEHHGRITVQSEPGSFCEFTIELPRNGVSQPSQPETA